VSATWRIIQGDALTRLREMPVASVHCCLTSPPYYGLRDYGVEGQLGLESHPDEYVQRLVEVFREVRRVLRDDGTLWLNLGDSYAANRPYQVPQTKWRDVGNHMASRVPAASEGTKRPDGLTLAPAIPADCKPKDLLGVPWMVAFALRADGWYLRQEIIWHKTAPMPESVRDRCTRAHEQVLMLSKQPRYAYDADALREEYRRSEDANGGTRRGLADGGAPHIGQQQRHGSNWTLGTGANRRSVWTFGPEPSGVGHFAVMPSKLARDMILAGCPERVCGKCGAPWERVVERHDRTDRARLRNVGGRTDGYTRGGGPGEGFYSEVVTLGFESSCACNAEPTSGVVLDPFAGAGTAILTALRHGRSAIGIELNPEYVELARRRVRDDLPLFNERAELAT
jgi:DNA modification methylase